jgi:hypothetical protein
MSFRKPSEIKADADKAQVALDNAAAPHRAKLEELKAEKATQINHYGNRIGEIRKKALAGAGITVEQFVEWRNLLYEAAEDDRPAIIETKATELGV